MDYFFAFIVFFIIYIIFGICCFILYLLYKIFKNIFSFIKNKTKKVKESHNNQDEIVSKSVNSCISDVCNNRMLAEIKYLYLSNLITPTNESYMMYVAASNIINDFKTIPFLFFKIDIKYSMHMKKMYTFYNKFENAINNYIINNNDIYIKKGIVSNNLKETIRKCIEKYYIDQFYPNNPEFYYHFFNLLIYYFQTF